MDLFGAFLTPSSWQKSFSQFVVIVIIVIPKLLQARATAATAIQFICDATMSESCSTVVSCKPCEAVPCGSVSESYS